LDRKEMQHPAPIFATVSRKTGDVRIEWGESPESMKRFGETLLRIGRDAEREEGRETRAEAI